MQIIVNSLWALFMKMQVSVSEATDCLRKMIGGESMGNWFENMEPMNIQEERANTKSCLLYTSPSPRDMRRSRMPSSA